MRRFLDNFRAVRQRLVIPLAALALGAMAPAAAQSPGPPASPSPSPSPSPATPASPLPAPAPSALATPLYTYIIVPPPPAPGSPVISEIAATARNLHPGDNVALRVTVSADVTAVGIEAYGSRFALTPAGPGRFVLAGTVPGIPFFFLNRNYTMNCVASTADGRTVSAPFVVHLSGN